MTECSIVKRRSDVTVGGKYQLSRIIGSGAFADVYLGISIESGKEVAVKTQSTSSNHHQLAFETEIYRILSGGVGFPRIHLYAREKNFYILVMDLLGPSLEDLFNVCNRHFTMKTILMLGNQMIRRLEFIHSNCIIHRDIKPANFLMGTGPHSWKVFLIDFGLAKRYLNPHSRVHIPYRQDKYFTGTPRYASINAHRGIEQSRRDDLEALGYVLMYFIFGRLPWQGLKAKNKQEKYEKTSEKMMSTPIDVLCKGSPMEFSMYLHYCRSLRFEQEPDYAYLRHLFGLLFRKLNLQYDYIFDWTLSMLGKPNLFRTFKQM
uniref:non-specific serine/threonine protein kinase n=1 Tax=Glossina brevipalpis TaxID=37001 RepID=A0A1A9W4P3_9MUSC